MAIKLTLNHIQNRTTRSELRITEKLHIFSDSQCAIGHLLLGWEAKTHKATINEVKSNIKNLEMLGIKVEISWTPGHSDIKGNEYADQLAKEAAEEAKEKKDLPAVITMGDVKTAARESGKKKWQDMWEKSEKGRTLFQFRPKVAHKIKYKFETRKGEIVVSQLRTGYVGLNEYLFKSNIVTSNKCQCGEIESVKHYLLECVMYDTARENMRRKLLENCGIAHLDLNLLLDAKQNENFKDWRNIILSELETYVAETKRFTTRIRN